MMIDRCRMVGFGRRLGPLAGGEQGSDDFVTEDQQRQTSMWNPTLGAALGATAGAAEDQRRKPSSTTFFGPATCPGMYHGGRALLVAGGDQEEI